MEQEQIFQKDVRTLLRFSADQVREAEKMILAGEPKDQILKRLLQSQRALRVAKALILKEQFQIYVGSILNGECPETRTEEIRRLITLFPSI